MNSRHGALESIILNALWELEKSGIYKHSVKEVYDFINGKIDQQRAYTTIKTVMDRLFEKEILLKVKQGSKFYYRTAYSYDDILRSSLEKIANQYCNGDITQLARYMQNFCDARTLKA